VRALDAYSRIAADSRPFGIEHRDQTEVLQSSTLGIMLDCPQHGAGESAFTGDSF
jgi:hypothetical protein